MCWRHSQAIGIILFWRNANIQLGPDKSGPLFFPLNHTRPFYSLGIMRMFVNTMGSTATGNKGRQNVKRYGFTCRWR